MQRSALEVVQPVLVQKLSGACPLLDTKVAATPHGVLHSPRMEHTTENLMILFPPSFILDSCANPYTILVINDGTLEGTWARGRAKESLIPEQ